MEVNRTPDRASHSRSAQRTAVIKQVPALSRQGKEEGETEAQRPPPQEADGSSQPSPGAYCVQWAAGREGQAVLTACPPLPPPPFPAGPLPRPGRKWEKWTGEEKLGRANASPLPTSTPPSHADPGGSGPQDPGVRGRVPGQPHGPQLGGGTRKAGQTTAQPAPRQPLPPLRPWRSGRRRLLYIIAAGQVGCFI